MFIDDDIRVDIDDTPPGTAVALLFVAATCVATQGCGGHAWDAHAATALALRDGSNTAADALEADHLEYLRTHGATAQTRAELDALSDQWREERAPLRNAQAFAAEATDTYANTTLDALRGEAADADEVIDNGRRALRSLHRLGTLMASAGVDWASEIPDWAAELLGAVEPDPDEPDAVRNLNPAPDNAQTEEGNEHGQ